MKKKTKLAHAEMILLAMYRCTQGINKRVPFESIVIQAWKDFPEEFSLNNHPEFPDSYVVSKRLYSDLITKRLVISLRKQVYRLTDKGLEIAKRLDANINAQGKDSETKSKFLNKEDEEFIKHALQSRTYRTWKDGNANDLIDYDARVFLQFSTGTPIRDRKRKFESAREAIEKAVALGVQEAPALQSLLEFLSGRFPKLFEEV